MEGLKGREGRHVPEQNLGQHVGEDTLVVVLESGPDLCTLAPTAGAGRPPAGGQGPAVPAGAKRSPSPCPRALTRGLSLMSHGKRLVNPSPAYLR